jgi:hypothetical protein
MPNGDECQFIKTVRNTIDAKRRYRFNPETEKEHTFDQQTSRSKQMLPLTWCSGFPKWGPLAILFTFVQNLLARYLDWVRIFNLNLVCTYKVVAHCSLLEQNRGDSAQM